MNDNAGRFLAHYNYCEVANSQAHDDVRACPHSRKAYLMKSEKGFSIMEFLIVTAISSIMMGMVALNFRNLTSPLQDGASQLSGFLKQVRAKAVSSTSAYVVEASSATMLTTKYATSCDSASFVSDPRLFLELPKETALTSTSWSVCFNSRGLADSSPEIYLGGGKHGAKSVSVYLGGAIRVQ